MDDIPTTMGLEEVRILLVEDSPSDADLFRMYIEYSPIEKGEVVLAESLSAALRQARQQTFDIVFLDYKLPDSDGEASLDRLLEIIPQVPIVMLTGLDDEDAALRLIRAGAQDYLIKDQASEKNIWQVLSYAIARKRIEERERRLEARLQDARRIESLEVVAGGIAHDYNNLLTSIMGNVDLVIGSLPEGHIAHPWLAEIQRETSRATELTQRMLIYSGQSHNRNELIELGDYIRHVSMWFSRFAGMDVEVDLRLEEGIVVRGDWELLRGLITHLVENAREAVPSIEDGEIILSLERVENEKKMELREGEVGYEILLPGSYACLTVEDNGTGMSEETQRRAFDPFFTTRFAGRGLGLSSVLGVVRSHNGAVRLESALGKGTKIRVFFPLSASGDPGVSVPDPVETETEVGVLVADSSALVLATTQNILDNHGFKVVTASSLAEIFTVGRIEGDRLQVMLVDPPLLGSAPERALKDLRELLPSVRIILSGRVAGMGAYPQLRKPYSPDELLRAINAALD